MLVKTRWRFRKSFVAFSEYMNFTDLYNGQKLRGQSGTLGYTGRDLRIPESKIWFIQFKYLSNSSNKIGKKAWIFFCCFHYLKKKLEIKIQLHSLKLQAHAKKTVICNINNRRNMFGHYTMHILKTAADD